MRISLLALLLVAACRRSEPTPLSVDAAPSASVSAIATTSPPTSSLPQLDDRCKKHADCEAILVFVEGDSRCCPAPSPQAAAVVSAASAFLAACADLQKTRDCPVPEKTSSARAACVAGHCVVAP
ncbi:MAG: hypothetical protein ACXWUG_02860 [Polyangiales bacterium]